MSDIPCERVWDNTVSLLSEGYTFGLTRFQRFQSDIFATRLLFRPAIFTFGEDAARMFYHPDRFTRRHAMPPNGVMLLQDYGSVQMLDEHAHRRRKEMFMSMMTPARLEQLNQHVAFEFGVRLRRWQQRPKVVLHDEMEHVLCRAVCQWAGIPLHEHQAKLRTYEFSAMIDGAGCIGPRNWTAMPLRARCEAWAQALINDVRRKRLHVPPGSALHTIAYHIDSNGELLEKKYAAVELLNVLRPTVAVARFITFAALALHAHSEARWQLENGGNLEAFVHEVRRFYPFFPMVAGLARTPFQWRGYNFEEGDWVFLDLYATTHDPRIWEDPFSFRPERFSDWDGSSYNFIPQGGGDHMETYRCAGEWITIGIMKTVVSLLLSAVRYDVPTQNVTISLTRMPAIPQSRFVIANVRPTGVLWEEPKMLA